MEEEDDGRGGATLDKLCRSEESTSNEYKREVEESRSNLKSMDEAEGVCTEAGLREAPREGGGIGSKADAFLSLHP